MNRIIKKLLNWKILMGGLVFFALLFGSTHFFIPSNAPENVDSLFFNSGGIESVYLEEANGKLHAITTGNKNGDLIIFIHGSPGSWTDFVSMADSFSLENENQLLFVDRPGFGESDLEHTGSLIEQADYVYKLVQQLEINSDRRIFVVGHSYGGPVACMLAIEHPEVIDGLAMVAPCIAWPYQVPKWYNSLASFLPVNLLLGDWLKNSNREMVRLYESELVNIEKRFNELSMPIVYVQGEKDILVDALSAPYFKDKCPDCDLKFIMDSEMNHFVPWSNPELIFDALNKLKAH